MTNRVKAANDALAAVVAAAFTGAAFKVDRNPDWTGALSSSATHIGIFDDKEPETVGALSGEVYDLKLSPRVLILRRATEANRAAGEWADLEALKAALATDRTLGGVVEDARCAEVEPAGHDQKQWLGGGLIVTVDLMFHAPSAVG